MKGKKDTETAPAGKVPLNKRKRQDGEEGEDEEPGGSEATPKAKAKGAPKGKAKAEAKPKASRRKK